MQKNISNKTIKKNLAFLKDNLPIRPTAVNELYSLPQSYSEEVTESNYSQESLQKISDHMGFYLGLLKSVKVTFIEETTGNRWVGTSDGTVLSDKNGAPLSGLYKTVGMDHNEILLIKKQKYQLKHIIAILAHECTHNYLYNHGLKRSEEHENEIFTEIAAAYLGLGGLLLAGYEPIIWTSNHWSSFAGSGCTKHTRSIGYVKTDTIRRAILLSSEIRGWDPNEIIREFSSQWDKIKAYVYLRHYKKKIKKILKEKEKSELFKKKISMQLDFLETEIDEINKIYDNVCNLIKHISTTISPKSINAIDGRIIVEITNKISIGELTSETKSVSEKIKNTKPHLANTQDVARLTEHVNKLKNIINDWHKTLSKYAT